MTLLYYCRNSSYSGEKESLGFATNLQLALFQGGGGGGGVGLEFNVGGITYLGEDVHPVDFFNL